MAESLCLYGGALGVMLLGLAGAFLPIIPGVPLIWLGAAIYGFLDGFNHLSLAVFFGLTLLAAGATTAEIWATQAGTKAGGASGWSAAAGSCAAMLVMLFFSLPLALLTAVASVLGLELLRSFRSPGPSREGVGQAVRGSGGWLAGWALSVAVQFSVSVLMILLFLWATLF